MGIVFRIECYIFFFIGVYFQNSIVLIAYFNFTTDYLLR